ncbi:MAG: hypothetical protein WBP45_13970 [Daejeonella sp.]
MFSTYLSISQTINNVKYNVPMVLLERSFVKNFKIPYAVQESNYSVYTLLKIEILKKEGIVLEFADNVDSSMVTQLDIIRKKLDLTEIKQWIDKENIYDQTILIPISIKLRDFPTVPIMNLNNLMVFKNYHIDKPFILGKPIMIETWKLH